MKIPEIKVPDIVGKIRESDKLNLKRIERSDSAEKIYESKLLLISVFAIMLYIFVAWLLIKFSSSEPLNLLDIIKGSLGSVFALFFAVIILDTINARNNKRKRKRDERRAVVRHNKIIQPVIDMYLVRKNMVITLNDKTIKKFQVKSVFTIKDMKDMYGPSELISDVGKSKIEVYSFYQDKLHDMFTHLVEDVDFNTYSDLCDAAMNYINATSYGASALEAVIGYQNSMTGTKSMRSVVLNMIRDEPENGKFIDAPAALKNVYLVHQLIKDQEAALEKYLELIKDILRENEKEMGKDLLSESDYE